MPSLRGQGREPSRDELLARRSTFVEGVAADRVHFERQIFNRILRKGEACSAAVAGSGGGPTVDVLMLSGGGDKGAFGAGFLKAWGEVTGPMRRPESFDCVTGVSTGSLISPFAFIGTPEASFPAAG